MSPDAADVAGFRAYIADFEVGLAVERAAATVQERGKGRA
jgi:hypothetical protein